ncbi:MAG TPA: S9 family peptidase [Bacteroidales bacterium]|nr:S9 family peptidase [Bacteroidales bacterium]
MKKMLILAALAVAALSFSGCKKVADYPLHPEINTDSLPETMTAELLWKLGRVTEPQVSPDGKLVLYGVTWYKAEDNKGNRDLYLVETANPAKVKRITMTDVSEQNARWRPDGKKIGFLAPNDSGIVQLYEINPDGSGLRILTGFKESVSGFSYSPDGTNILYTMDIKLDKECTDVYPDLPGSNAMMIDNLMYRHWDHWHDYRYSHIFIAPYNADGITAGRDIMEGEPYDCPMVPTGGMEQINWSPDGKKVAYTCKKVSGKEYALSTNSEIYLYYLATGKTELLSKGGFDGYDHNPVFSPDGNYIAWRSMETPGFEADKTRLILYSFTDGQTRDLTLDFDQSTDNYVWSKKGDKIFFISGIEATYHVYSVTVSTAEITRLTTGAFDYTDLVLAGDRLVGSRMDHANPSELFTIASDGTQKQLTTTNKHILDHIRPARSVARWIKTTDGKMMHTWVILPPLFDSTKTYPAILYCQGGPQSAVSQFFSFRWNFQIMAAHGYVVIAPNRRGLPTFGQEWNDQISGDYGGQNMQDYLSAIDEVSKEKWVDNKRLGAVGASYGAFSVYWLAGNHQNRFKAFIAHNGMFNLESMYGSTEEYFFVNHDLGGPYWDPAAKKSYDASPHRFVKNWNTPIMIVAGGYDFRIPYTQGMEAFNAAQLLGVPSKLLFFPEESHFVLKPQNSILWQREFFGWLDKYLKN